MMRDVLYIDAEGGKATLQDSPRIKLRDQIMRVRVTDFKQVAHLHDWLKAHCRARDANDIPQLARLEAAVTGIAAEDITAPKRFRTVVLDSLTEIEQYSVYSILGINQDNLLQDDMDVAGWPEFRRNNESVKLTVRAYRDLPMHVILLCVSQYSKDERNAFHYTPSLTGKLSAQIQGFVDVVGYLTVDAPDAQGVAKRKLAVQPVGGGAKFDAKNRKTAFTSIGFENPTMLGMLRAFGMIQK